MRFQSLTVVACLLLGACVSTSTRVTGISRAAAISTAEAACPEYPDPFPVADQARWSYLDRVWVVTITDPKRLQGEYFKINGAGKIVDRGSLRKLEKPARNSEKPRRLGRPYEQQYPEGPFHRDSYKF